MSQIERMPKRRDIPNPLFADNLFDSLMWGDPGVQIGEVREEFRAVAQREYLGDSVWSGLPMAVARCATLGIHPSTGEPLENPDEFITRYNDKESAFDDLVRFYYKGYKEDDRIQQALQQERFPQQ